MTSIMRRGYRLFLCFQNKYRIFELAVPTFMDNPDNANNYHSHQRTGMVVHGSWMVFRVYCCIGTRCGLRAAGSPKLPAVTSSVPAPFPSRGSFTYMTVSLPASLPAGARLTIRDN